MSHHIQGKLVVALMFLLAGALGAYAWWHRYSRDPRCREFWGDALSLIENASQVEYLVLEREEELAPTATSGKETFRIGESAFVVRDRALITRAPGLIHARHALTVDSGYRWDEPVSGSQLRWECGLRMSDGGRTATILFSSDFSTIWWVERSQGLRLIPASATAFAKMRREWQPPGAAAMRTPQP
jgi:hypothetical protein